MKLLHTADLHLGRRLNDIPLLDDQKKVLSDIVSIAKSEKVDALIVSGDIYDKSSPMPECYKVFDSFLTALNQEGIPVIAISGNHDSNERISYLSHLLTKSRIFLSDVFQGRIETIAFKDGFGDVVFHLLPFVKPAIVRTFFPEERIESYQDAIAVLLKNHPVDTSKRNVILVHQFITGAQTCDSEILSLGGSEAIEASLFADYDYVALGHIHKAQKMTRETCRYAGSPIKYSLSEERHVKSVTLVDMKEKGNIEIKTFPLPVYHDVRTIEGSYDDIRKMPYSHDFVHVILKDEEVPPNARDVLKTVFPNMIRFSIANSKTAEDYAYKGTASLEKKSIEDLFTDFYKMQNNGVSPTKEHFDLLNKALQEMEKEEDGK